MESILGVTALFWRQFHTFHLIKRRAFPLGAPRRLDELFTQKQQQG